MDIHEFRNKFGKLAQDPNLSDEEFWVRITDASTEILFERISSKMRQHRWHTDEMGHEIDADLPLFSVTLDIIHDMNQEPYDVVDTLADGLRLTTTLTGEYSADGWPKVKFVGLRHCIEQLIDRYESDPAVVPQIKRSIKPMTI